MRWCMYMYPGCGQGSLQAAVKHDANERRHELTGKKEGLAIMSMQNLWHAWGNICWAIPGTRNRHRPHSC